MCVKHFRDCMPLLDATTLVLSSAREKAQLLNLSKMELGTLRKNWDVNRQFLVNCSDSEDLHVRCTVRRFLQMV